MIDEQYVVHEYDDGDFVYDPPEWKIRFHERERKHQKIDHDSLDTKSQYIQPNELAMKHPHNQSLIKVGDDGSILLFAGDQLGMRIDPETNSIQLFADNLHFMGKRVAFHTYPTGLWWNGYAFNPELYYEDDQETAIQFQAQKQKWTKEKGWQTESKWVRPMIRPTMNTSYSEGVIQLLKELGLPTEE